MSEPMEPDTSSLDSLSLPASMTLPPRSTEPNRTTFAAPLRRSGGFVGMLAGIILFANTAIGEDDLAVQTPTKSTSPASSQKASYVKPSWNQFRPRATTVFRTASSSRPATDSQPEYLPLLKPSVADNVSLTADDADRVNLIATEASLVSLLRMIADHHELNLVIAPGIDAPVTISIRDAELNEVLDAIVHIAGFHWHQSGNLLYVTGSSATGDPRLQGRVVNVYPLDYVRAIDVQTAVTGMLSPLGNVVINESSSTDQQKTREMLIVEDTMDAHIRIAEVIARLNRPPQQVLVEAHVLQVGLDENTRHGINLRSLARIGNSRVTLGGLDQTVLGSAPGQGMSLQLQGTDLEGLIQCIQENFNSRTLASPKISIVNQQEAKIQIGRRVPYTEIANLGGGNVNNGGAANNGIGNTIQNVRFLDVGIILTVTPIITEDGNILMTVLPKVSDATVDPASGLPEEVVTEVSTTVLMPDGGGLIIGGLIEEKLIQARSVVPGLHRIPVLGRLFKKDEDEMTRNELIVALVTHVVHGPNCVSSRSQEQIDLQTALPEYAIEGLQLNNDQVPSWSVHDTGHSVIEADVR